MMFAVLLSTSKTAKMKSEDIEKFFARKATLNEGYVKITFKKRDAIYGLFLKDADYLDLKTKNFWRVVPQSNLQAYTTSKNASLSRLFNGNEFSKLAAYTESFE